MHIRSKAFLEGGMIPAKYTSDGTNVSPPLEWTGVPAGTKSFALINDDPDAPSGTWVHWVMYDLPPDTAVLEENVRPERTCANGAKQGRNDFSDIGYGGPSPPSGTHRYVFALYAVDTMLDLNPGATRDQVLQAMRGHVLAEAKLTAKYRRQMR